METAVQDTTTSANGSATTNGSNGAVHQSRNLKTKVWFADEERYQEELAAKGGEEDMWQGGDM
jgi:hypothetical protein